MRILFSSSILLAIAVLTGCDTVYGVTRSATVAFMPPAAKVDSLVRSVPGVQTVEYHVMGGGKGVSLHGVEPLETVHTFIYRGGADVLGKLDFTEDYHHRVRYSQSVARFGSPPPQREVDATLPVMREIEARLETRAGLSGLRNSVVQHCNGVQCP